MDAVAAFIGLPEDPVPDAPVYIYYKTDHQADVVFKRRPRITVETDPPRMVDNRPALSIDPASLGETAVLGFGRRESNGTVTMLQVTTLFVFMDQDDEEDQFRGISQQDWESLCPYLVTGLMQLETIHLVMGPTNPQDDLRIATLLQCFGAIPTLRTVVFNTTLAILDRHGPLKPCKLALTFQEISNSIAQLTALRFHAGMILTEDSRKALAATIKALPKLSGITLPSFFIVSAIKLIDDKTTDEAGDDDSAGLDIVVDAIRNKDTLESVHNSPSDPWVPGGDVAAKLQTYPQIHQAIREYGIMPVDASGAYILPNLAPPDDGGPRPFRDYMSPPTQAAKENLPRWISAMAHCLQEDRFDCFHYFFSQIEPAVYLEDPTKLEAVLFQQAIMPAAASYNNEKTKEQTKELCLQRIRNVVLTPANTWLILKWLWRRFQQGHIRLLAAWTFLEVMANHFQNHQPQQQSRANDFVVSLMLDAAKIVEFQLVLFYCVWLGMKEALAFLTNRLSPANDTMADPISTGAETGTDTDTGADTGTGTHEPEVGVNEAGEN